MASPTPSSSSSSPRSSSLLRRLKPKTPSSLLPFRPSRKPISDFHITLTDPHRVYSSHQLVTGAVCITVERPLAITHLTVALIGRVDIHSTTTAPGAKWEDPIDAHGGYNASGGSPTGLVFARDEAVLAGEGRLEPGVYRFQFELEFCRLPVGGDPGSIPTSIDFEKGSISYGVVATITRPTTSNPTTSCSIKVQHMETVDIASLPAPKPRLIELEPIRHRPTPPKRAPSSVTPTPTSSYTTLPDPSTTTPKSPSLTKKDPITATVTLLTAGALRGGSITVRVSVQHTKRIKSLHGIIVTLMRHTRFDTLDTPAKPSRSLPQAAFRKDLAQTICPLIVDPHTLTADVKATVKVPEVVFPTTSRVPGGGVEFRYYVEVVMDLRGKMEGVGRAAGGQGTGMDATGMVETEKVRRREKSVVACKFEVVIGSVDSSVGKVRAGERTPEPVVLQLSMPQGSTQRNEDQTREIQLPPPAPPPAPQHQQQQQETAPEYYPPTSPPSSSSSSAPPPANEKSSLQNGPASPTTSSPTTSSPSSTLTSTPSAPVAAPASAPAYSPPHPIPSSSTVAPAYTPSPSSTAPSAPTIHCLPSPTTHDHILSPITYPDPSLPPFASPLDPVPPQREPGGVDKLERERERLMRLVSEPPSEEPSADAGEGEVGDQTVEDRDGVGAAGERGEEEDEGLPVYRR